MTIKDGEWCGDVGEFGAECVHTLSPAKRTLDKVHWDVQRIGWVCTSPESFTDLKTSLQQLCAAQDICDYEDVKKTLKALERLENL